ncbi:hypothetical protein ACP_2998 [Acidobacterium capsulatum ATCC 51196]|uniref:Uncharacterized protein n=1 Tax=Acidobacterium capsulatum (strain ATCC 51196 / DSM 11244 / BCRC 80197 / JCM 7670 / NBRC 15755 / NCIMB 13165 / 161) TaxID=240015 RepID=C1F4F5_ACIC5|nr:hypothetical protein ACP_2998 [Acidobacterium capsulatum ATCC 51196]
MSESGGFFSAGADWEKDDPTQARLWFAWVRGFRRDAMSAGNVTRKAKKTSINVLQAVDIAGLAGH